MDRAYCKSHHIRLADSHQQASWGLVLGPMLFDGFINYLNKEIGSRSSTLLMLPKE